MQLLQPALPPALPQLSGLWEAKVLAPLGVQAPPGERHVWAELQLRSQISLTFQGPQKLNAHKLIILIILEPRKK